MEHKERGDKKGWHKTGLIERRQKRKEAQQGDQKKSLEGGPKSGGRGQTGKCRRETQSHNGKETTTGGPRGRLKGRGLEMEVKDKLDEIEQV